jgi:hypothetical protein
MFRTCPFRSRPHKRFRGMFSIIPQSFKIARGRTGVPCGKTIYFYR